MSFDRPSTPSPGPGFYRGRDMSTFIAIFRIITAPVVIPVQFLLFVLGDLLANLHGSFVRGWRHRA